MIPRIFHQIWLGPDRLPEQFAVFRETWRAHHPSWELRLWGEENLPPDLRHEEVYDRRRSPAERSDILRLELLLWHGGIYVDTDFECRRPLDPLLEGVHFFAGLLKADGERVNNALFGAAAGHPLLERALRELRPQEIDTPFDKSASGSLFFDRLVRDSPGVELVPAERFYPSTPEQRERAYAIHHAARSWKDGEGWRQAALRAEKRLEKVLAELEKERRAHAKTKRKVEKLERRVAARLGRGVAAPTQAVPAVRERVLEPEPERLSVLFFLRSIHYDRVFENLLRALLARGHQVHVALPLEKRGLGDGKTRLFDELRDRYRFSYEQLRPRRDRWLAPAVALRHALDYLRYLEPDYSDAEPLRERARSRAPLGVRALLAVPPFRTRAGRRAIGTVLRWLEASVPIPKSISALIASHAPDVVLVSPLVGLGSIETDYLRAATRRRIPTVLPVASWDNLTNKGLLHDVPTTTIVWNEAQVEEAVQLHGVPREQVIAVGAHSFDHWFSWRPSTTREEFAARLNLDADRPFLLYLGSSFFISGDETPYVREWLSRVRGHPRLCNTAVILRPHPQNVVGWAELDVEEPGKTAISPREGVAPTDDRTKRDFFDALFHASAAVGVNTSALIEAAITRRPVLTLENGTFATQKGTLHFSHIAGGDDALVVVGRSWEEHLEQIADAVEAPEGHRRRSERFLTTFVRPGGLESPAAPAAVDAVEAAAAEAVPATDAPVLGRVLLVISAPVLLLLGGMARPKRTWRTAMKSVKRHVKQLRRRRKQLKRKIPRRLRTGGVFVRERRPPAQGPARRVSRARREPVAGNGQPKSANARRTKPWTIRAAKRSRKALKLARRRWKYAKRDVRRLLNMRFRVTYASTINRVPSRDEIPALLNRRGLVGLGVEIGVKGGKYSDHLLRRWEGRQLISIDPWLAAAPEDYVDRSNVSQDEFEGLYLSTKERLGLFGSRSEIWRMTSVEAARRIPDGALDFVYIDARHDYESVREDLEAWYPKVRPGGILAGHDYVDGVFPQGNFGVKSAVDEFFAARGIPVHGTQGPSAVEMFPSWIVERPEDLFEQTPGDEVGSRSTTSSAQHRQRVRA